MHSRRDMSSSNFLSASTVASLPSREALSNSNTNMSRMLLLTLRGGSISNHDTACAAVSQQLLSLATSSESGWQLVSGKGRFPTGSKFLKGDSESFVISPLSSIVDEKYTAYFEFESS